MHLLVTEFKISHMFYAVESVFQIFKILLEILEIGQF